MTYTKENPAILKRYDKIFFGKKEKGNMVGDVLKKNPKFIIWCHENLDWVKFTDDVIAEAKGLYHSVSPQEIYKEVVERYPKTFDKLSDTDFNKMQEQYNNYWDYKTDDAPYLKMQESYKNSFDKLSIFTKIKNYIYAKVRTITKKTNG